jgi:hypothetical protein
VIKKLLDWNEAHDEPDLTQIEDIVLELREELGLEFVASLMSSQEKVEPVVERCRVCGREMRNKGRKRKVVESRVGEIELERGYYYCPECGAGIFPLDRQLKVEGKQQSAGVSKLSVWLSGLVPFERAAEVLEQVGRIRTSRGSVWQQSSLWGSKFQAEEEKVQKKAAEVELRNGVWQMKNRDARPFLGAFLPL